MQPHVARPRLTTKIFRLHLSFDFVLTKPGTLLEIVVIAYNEKHARNLASYHYGIEGSEIWHNRTDTECVEIGRPHRGYHYPQVLAKYIQTPYREERNGTICEETGPGAVSEMDDGTGGQSPDTTVDGQGDGDGQELDESSLQEA